MQKRAEAERLENGRFTHLSIESGQKEAVLAERHGAEDPGEHYRRHERQDRGHEAAGNIDDHPLQQRLTGRTGTSFAR